MKIVYTELTETYIDGITELDRLCFTVPWSRNLFLSELHSNNAFYILALHNDRVIGYCGINYVCGEGSITNIAVHPDYRKKGLASLMLDNIIKYCTNCTLSFITLEVRQSNQSAINLYKKYGFNEVGLRKNYYADNHENAILMTKYIKEVH